MRSSVHKFKGVDFDHTLDNRKQHRKLKLQDQSRIRASFPDAVAILAGLTSVETTSGKPIIYQYLRDVGQPFGLQRRKTAIILLQLLKSKHAQTISSRLGPRKQAWMVKGMFYFKEIVCRVCLQFLCG